MVRRITILLFVAQILCWFAFIYLLYFGVPCYKALDHDYTIFSTSAWRILVSMSDWVVINPVLTYSDWGFWFFYTHGDLGFWLSLIVFLAALIGLNLVIGRPTFRTKGWVIWSIPAFIAPFALLCFELVTIAVSTKRVIQAHPDVLDYGLWWVNLFA